MTPRQPLPSDRLAEGANSGRDTLADEGLHNHLANDAPCMARGIFLFAGRARSGGLPPPGAATS